MLYWATHPPENCALMLLQRTPVLQKFIATTPGCETMHDMAVMLAKPVKQSAMQEKYATTNRYHPSTTPVNIVFACFSQKRSGTTVEEYFSQLQVASFSACEVSTPPSSMTSLPLCHFAYSPCCNTNALPIGMFSRLTKTLAECGSTPTSSRE